jgi:hypothetical protein
MEIFSLVSLITFLGERLSRIMSAPVERHALLLEQLHLSICLLGLLAERPANLDELVLDHKDALLEKSPPDNVDSGEGYPEEDLEEEEVEIISAEDMKQRNHKALRNKVLDRLAETLARYKSDRTVIRFFASAKPRRDTFAPARP